MARIVHPEMLQGKYVNLREVRLDDAAFILELRTDEKKSRFLHKTDPDLQKQIDYLKRYFTLDNEWYFIIENKKHEPLGTIRIYNVQGPRFTGGSWLMKDGASPQESFEGHLLFRRYAFEVFNFEESVIDVRKSNTKVVRYHKICGSKIIGETDLDYIFITTREIYWQNKDKLFSMLG
ncbi:GNAT family N-acetyltransferase [uncultured Mailhella sp.]|uniref:GNAT family N-acetyltransferase n=1 Tax=uncultured Mailhella sp. TaxID=1981031 RepID=UPI002639881F|nr:GNAT family N-acetyltransferase [uncultured Mailhella sp.]